MRDARTARAVIDLTGELELVRRARARTPHTRRPPAAAPTSVVLNFAGADYINSTGIALIVGLLAQARGARGRGAAPAGLSDHYREIFEITRLADFMTIVDTRTAP